MPVTQLAQVTSREEFRTLAATHRVVPVVRQFLADADTALSAYTKLAHGRPGSFLLESAAVGQSWSRYSYIGCGARTALTVKDGETVWIGQAPAWAPTGQPLKALAETLELLHTDSVPGMPPLSSGFVGFFSHDIIRYVEDIPDTCENDLHMPEMMQILVEDLAVFDHHQGVITLIANAVNWDGSDERVDQAYDDAVARIAEMQRRLASPAPSDLLSPALFDVTAKPNFRRQRSREEHMRRVEQLRQRCADGEAGQVVLSQRFEMDTDATALDIYRMLRISNPSPYMFLLNLPTDDFTDTAFQIVGSSPESLVSVQGGIATTHPIGGTRPRGATEAEDVALEAELRADEKENVEHQMLIDLGVSDISKAAAPGTVEVTNAFRIERYSHVMHLVSTVSGTLADGRGPVDAFIANFPAGTLSGAPRVKALALIDELEDTRRGFYGGTVGYFDLSGNTDQAITIRSGLVKDGTVYVQAGGGIVAESDPAMEDDETLNKSAAVLAAVAAAQTLRTVS